MRSMDELACLVTGASSGLGRAIVRRFLDEGAHVATMQSSADGTAAVEREFGGEVLAIRGDVRRLADNIAAADAAVAQFGRLDVFVGNAAVWDCSISLEALPGERIELAAEELLAINVTGQLLGAKACVGHLRNSKGTMIFTVSNSGFMPGGGGPIYTASKHALVGLIRQLAMELAPDIRVNGVAAGGMATELRGPAALGLQDARVPPDLLERIFVETAPLAFLPDPSDYAASFAFLASRDGARATTGSVLNCDVGLAVRPIA